MHFFPSILYTRCNLLNISSVADTCVSGFIYHSKLKVKVSIVTNAIASFQLENSFNYSRNSPQKQKPNKTRRHFYSIIIRNIIEHLRLVYFSLYIYMMTWIHHGVYYNLSVFSVARMFSVFRVACTCAKLFMSLMGLFKYWIWERERKKNKNNKLRVFVQVWLALLIERAPIDSMLNELLWISWRSNEFLKLVQEKLNS